LPLAGAALAACAGVVVADLLKIGSAFWLGPFVIAVSVLLWRPRILSCWLAVMLGFATLHQVRHYEAPVRHLATQLSQPRVVRAVGVVVTEPEAPDGWSKIVTARFRMRLESIELNGTNAPIGGLVQVRWAGEVPAYGDRVELRGSMVNLAPARNPGQFDFRDYAARLGLYSEITAKYSNDCRILMHGQGSLLQSAAFRCRRWIHDQLALDLAEEPAVSDLIASMVLGMRGETPEEIQNLFRATGTLHLFAVSGLNVAMLAGIVWFVLKPLRISRRFAIYLTIPLLLLYAMVTGLPASCVRATIMGSVLLAGFIFERPPSVFNSLAAAALLILAWDTNQFFAPGFQFSFALVLAIAWMARRIEQRIEVAGRPDDFLPKPLWNWRIRAGYAGWRIFSGAAGVTMAAWFGSLLFTAGYFHLLSISAIGANLLAVPLAFAILALGLFATIAAPVSATLTILFNNANWACTKVLLMVVQFFAAIPGGHSYVEVPSFRSEPAAELTIFDIGEGGAAHLRIAGEEWMVDCGNRFEFERIVLAYLRSRGVDRVDRLILTHGDAQHIGAARDLWTDLLPAVLYDLPLKDRSPTRRGIHQLLAEAQAGKRFAYRGETLLAADNASIEVLFPPAGLQRSTADDKAMVIRITIGTRRILMMSDAGFATEQWLMQNEPDLRSDILVKGWHDKDVASSTDFLARVQPVAAIVGATSFRKSEGGVREWVEQAAERGIRVFQQADCGAVSIRCSADNRVEVTGFLDGQKMVLGPN
jgi:ComEC/Rec2-related protein